MQIQRTVRLIMETLAVRRFIFTLLFLFFVAGIALGQQPLPEPPEDNVKLELSLVVLDLDSINDADQSFEASVFYSLRWQDPRLAHEGNRNRTIPVEGVWFPNPQILSKQRTFKSFPEVVEVSPAGVVFYRQREWGSFSQPLQLADFPFDEQTFDIQIVIPRQDGVNFEFEMSKNCGIAKKLSIADWKVVSWETQLNPVEILRQPLPSVGLQFQVERLSSYYVVQVLVPLILIVAMSWAAFWLDSSHSGDQINVAITAMLTLIAYRFAVGIHLPRVPYLTRLDHFILSSTVLVFATLMSVVIGSYLKSERVVKWGRGIFPLLFIFVTVLAFLN